MPERKKKEDRRMKISGTIKPEQFEWLKDKIKEGKFYNISHVLQEGIKSLQEKDT
jgi:Arc/MetJ-type ribon-helix-helix transcriptional regulator